MGKCPVCSQDVCLSRWGFFRSNKAEGSPHPPASRCGRTQSGGKLCSSVRGPQDRVTVPRASGGQVSRVHGGNLEDRHPKVAEPCLGALGSFRKREGPARPRSGCSVRAGVKPQEYPRGSQVPHSLKDAGTWSLDSWMPSLSLWEPHPGPALCAHGGSPPWPSPPCPGPQPPCPSRGSPPPEPPRHPRPGSWGWCTGDRQVGGAWLDGHLPACPFLAVWLQEPASPCSAASIVNRGQSRAPGSTAVHSVSCRV